jgi:hypothetical protein
MEIKREVIQVKTKNGDWVSVAYFDSRYDLPLLNQLKKERPNSYRLRTEIITIETT